MFMIMDSSSSRNRIPREAVYKHLGPALKHLLDIDSHLKKSALAPELRELIKIRVSQINGCAFCIIYHRKDALALGVSDRKIHLLSAWREAAEFSPRERAALAWAEAVTKIAEEHLPDPVYNEAQQLFSEQELVELNLIVMTINSWNRLAIPFHYEPDPE
jgi:AhpD family alkylhydroperoxidase